MQHYELDSDESDSCFMTSDSEDRKQAQAAYLLEDSRRTPHTVAAIRGHVGDDEKWSYSAYCSKARTTRFVGRTSKGPKRSIAKSPVVYQLPECRSLCKKRSAVFPKNSTVAEWLGDVSVDASRFQRVVEDACPDYDILRACMQGVGQQPFDSDNFVANFKQLLLARRSSLTDYEENKSVRGSTSIKRSSNRLLKKTGTSTILTSSWN